MRISFFSIKRKVALLLFSFLLTALFSFSQRASDLLPDSSKQKNEFAFPKASQFSKTKLTYTIINAPNKTFCYDIYADGKLMIHQYSIPAMPGNEGFKTKQGAEKVAKLVIEKIRKGEMPPTISIAEMKKVKAL